MEITDTRVDFDNISYIFRRTLWINNVRKWKTAEMVKFVTLSANTGSTMSTRCWVVSRSNRVHCIFNLVVMEEQTGAQLQLERTLHATRCGHSFPKPSGGDIRRRRVTTSRCLMRPLPNASNNAHFSIPCLKTSWSHNENTDQMSLTNPRDTLHHGERAANK